jgi:hypothetical protein
MVRTNTLRIQDFGFGDHAARRRLLRRTWYSSTNCPRNQLRETASNRHFRARTWRSSINCHTDSRQGDRRTPTVARWDLVQFGQVSRQLRPRDRCAPRVIGAGSGAVQPTASGNGHGAIEEHRGRLGNYLAQFDQLPPATGTAGPVKTELDPVGPGAIRPTAGTKARFEKMANRQAATRWSY